MFIQRVAQQNIKSVPFFLNSRYTFDKGTKSATTGYLHPNNMNLDTDFPSIIKVNSKWIAGLNIRPIGENLKELGYYFCICPNVDHLSDDNFLDTRPKA